MQTITLVQKNEVKGDGDGMEKNKEAARSKWGSRYMYWYWRCLRGLHSKLEKYKFKYNTEDPQQQKSA